ncbi:hypothetical protein yc1106_08676 [Curvularia clavata]|uniref:NADH dehydrogenase [ubiquinone] 1 alpha subcomplex subunit 1 n=1 Tax=Curvularia clavata TaxID=95742 RepID=A0A9Q8ZDQ7_CURCL|nr:hypothetical protein yc1106_08676 [Curvularia clavata]
MGVPFEALLPYAIMTGFFAFSAVSVGKLKEIQNGGKRTRRGIDAWDRVSCVLRMHRMAANMRTAKYDHFTMTSSIPSTYKRAVMERDRRLTGFMRGQTDQPAAPPGFELNNPWRCEQRFF